MFTKITYNKIKITNIPKIKNIRSFETLNKLRIGARITRIKPNKLLIKKRG